ncbi:MAG: hypothetical protein HY910_14100 [Desulfarculus sp.]|nr:hypothetical protein [Desulfarculus sp.]
MPSTFAPHFTATGVGTLPHLDPRAAVADVCARLPQMPYWPQLPRLSAIEDMNLQYARALSPLVAADLEGRSLLAHPGMSREEALAAFYERLLAGPQEDFGLLPHEAAGFFAFLEQVGAAGPGAFPWVKGHVTGPLTLAASVLGTDGKALLYDDEMAEALAKGLGVAAAAQVRQLAPLGRPVLLFFDEPFLSGYGSAFSPVSREKVVELLGLAAQETRARVDAVLGVHCCGNTDWGMLVDAGLDVLNLDSAGFGEHLLLYPQALRDLYARGGAVAWGAVPTVKFTGQETAPGLWAGLRGLLDKLVASGFDPATLARQALITPACGLGGLEQDKALAILDLTRQVSELARQELAV